MAFYNINNRHNNVAKILRQVKAKKNIAYYKYTPIPVRTKKYSM